MSTPIIIALDRQAGKQGIECERSSIYQVCTKHRIINTSNKLALDRKAGKQGIECERSSIYQVPGMYEASYHSISTTAG